MNMARKKSTLPSEGPSFEEALEELQAIVDQLDEGQLPLNDALQGFERGIHLYRVCSEILENAESKVELLQSHLKGSVPETVNFDSMTRSSTESALGEDPFVSSDRTETTVRDLPAMASMAPFDTKEDLTSETDSADGNSDEQTPVIKAGKRASRGRTENPNEGDSMDSESFLPRPNSGLF